MQLFYKSKKFKKRREGKQRIFYYCIFENSKSIHCPSRISKAKNSENMIMLCDHNKICSRINHKINKSWNSRDILNEYMFNPTLEHTQNNEIDLKNKIKVISEEEFIRTLTLNSTPIHEATGNGNCFYECISYITGKTISQIRQAVANNLLQKNFCYVNIAPRDYARLVVADKFYASAVEVLAVSELLKANIFILCDGVLKTINDFTMNNKNYIVLNHKNEHFDLNCFDVDSEVINEFPNIEDKTLKAGGILKQQKCVSCELPFNKHMNLTFRLQHYSICTQSVEDGKNHLNKFKS